MNPINRIGQKVRCVGDERVWLLLVCPSLKEFPRRGEVYTVAGFETYAGLPAIHLREVADLECSCARMSGVPWLLSVFKPLDERKTDIGDLQALLNAELVNAEVTEHISGVVARVAQLFGMRVGDLQRLLREPKGGMYGCPICGRFDCDWTHNIPAKENAQ